MTLTLNLAPDLEQRLSKKAARRGISAGDCTVQLLEQHLPRPERRVQLVALLQSWIDDAEGKEQQETGDYLVRVLDEDRLSDRKLFPPDLKGLTW